MHRLDQRTGSGMTDRLKRYRSDPNVTFSDYVALLERETAREASRTTRVYLDLRYWIFCRDASLGKAQRPIHSKILTALTAAVDSGRVVCPITESVFFELDRQGVTERRMQTARVIDQLSRGLVIKHTLDRAHAEVLDYLGSMYAIHKPPIRLCVNVWVRPYSFLGTPRFSGLGAAADLTINKSFASFMWTRSVEDLLVNTPVSNLHRDLQLESTAELITTESARHAPSMRSFAQVLSNEVRGVAESYGDAIFQAYLLFLTAKFGDDVGFRNDLSTGKITKEVCVSTVCELIRSNRIGLGFPTFRIMAGLYSFIRWNRNRSFSSHDSFDIRHAAAAIPYCQVFLTEKFLKTACTSGLLDFGSTFGCRIISDEAEALDAIKQLTP